MKVATYLENEITVGGGFNQGLNTIIQMKQICEGNFDFEVFTGHSNNLEYLRKVGINAVLLRFKFFDKVFFILSKNLFGQVLIASLKLISPFEQTLINNNIDLIYFLTQSSTPTILNKLNYITTVFDLCHRDMPEFPEVRYFNEFNKREYHFKNNLSRAFLVITNSEELIFSISKRYGIDSNRLLLIPYSPSPFLEQEYSVDMSAVLRLYQLEKGYFFYPAQFWPHKNHIRILEALIHLRNHGTILNVVFTGSDKGNLEYIHNFVDRQSLSGQVKFLDFVPSEHMRGLYEASLAVVMPTYFGPTNLPPLEAWMIGKPLIYSEHFKDQVKDAAICVNPDNSEELADSMKICTDPNACAFLVEAGYKRLNEIRKQLIESESILKRCLSQFELRRRCWP